MAGEEMKRALHLAVINGDLENFQEVVGGDSYVLNEVLYPGRRNLLHVAVIHGRDTFVDFVLQVNPFLAGDVDSEKYSALHHATVTGSVAVTKILLGCNAEPRRWRNCSGFNPAHIAAMQGHSDVLRALLEEDFSPALDFVPGRDTILHICIIYNRFEALQYLLPTLPRDFVRGSNENGETLLHLAVRYCRPEMIQYLVAKTDISKVATNFMECTAWDGARHIDPPIRNLLVGSDPLVDVLVRNYNVVRWTLLSVAAVIATTASQTIVSPPGGVYQDGRSVLAVIHHSGFESIMGSNFSSLVWTVIAMILILCTVRWNGFLMVLFILYLLLASTICVVVSKLSSIGVLAQENRTILGVLEVFAFETVVMLSGVGIAWVLYKFGYAPAWRRFIRIVWNFICN